MDSLKNCHNCTEGHELCGHEKEMFPCSGCGQIGFPVFGKEHIRYIENLKQVERLYEIAIELRDSSDD